MPKSDAEEAVEIIMKRVPWLFRFKPIVFAFEIAKRYFNMVGRIIHGKE